MAVVSVPDANSYTVSLPLLATSTASGGGGTSVTANYSQVIFYIWKYTTTGWTTIASNRSSCSVL